MKFFNRKENREFNQTTLTSPIEIPPSDFYLSKYKFGLSRADSAGEPFSEDERRSSHSVDNHKVEIKVEAEPEKIAKAPEPANDLLNFMMTFKNQAVNEASPEPVIQKEESPVKSHSWSSDKSRSESPKPKTSKIPSKIGETAYLKFLSTNFEPDKIDKKLVGNQFHEEDEILVHDPEKNYKFKRSKNTNPLGKKVDDQKRNTNNEHVEELDQRQDFAFDMDNFLKKLKPKKDSKTASVSKRSDDKIRFKKIKPI